METLFGPGTSPRWARTRVLSDWRGCSLACFFTRTGLTFALPRKVTSFAGGGMVVQELERIIGLGVDRRHELLLHMPRGYLGCHCCYWLDFCTRCLGWRCRQQAEALSASLNSNSSKLCTKRYKTSPLQAYTAWMGKYDVACVNSYFTAIWQRSGVTVAIRDWNYWSGKHRASAMSHLRVQHLEQR